MELGIRQSSQMKPLTKKAIEALYNKQAKNYIYQYQGSTKD